MSAAPKVLKIIRLVGKCESELSSMEPKPYGGSNPYYYCSKCQRSMIEVSYAGHYKGCEYLEMENKLKSLQGQMKQEIELFLSTKEYESVSYKNYLWFKGNKHIGGMYELERAIKDYQKTLSK